MANKGVVWNKRYDSNFEIKLGYFYAVDFKNPNSPVLVRRHFYTKELANVWIENLALHPKFKAHLDSFVILPYNKVKDLRIRTPMFILSAKWFDERYRVSKYKYPPGLTDRQKLQYRTKIRRKNIYNQKQYKEMNPKEVIQHKPNLFITRYVKYYWNNELAYSNPVNCFHKIKKALRKEGRFYPSEFVIMTNIIRVLDRFYPGNYSRTPVAIKLYKKYGDKIKSRKSRYYKALASDGRAMSPNHTPEEAHKELIARGFLPSSQIGFTPGNGSVLQSIDRKLTHPLICSPVNGDNDEDLMDIYLHHERWGLSGYTRATQDMNY